MKTLSKTLKKLLPYESKLNSFLSKWFNRKFSFNGTTFFYQKGKTQYECVKCKKAIYDLPNMSSKSYAFTLDPVLNIQEQITSSDEGLQIYGWIVEYKWPGTENRWYQHYNHKIYDKKELAIDVINQLRLNRSWRLPDRTVEYRIRPIYIADQSHYRNIVINRLLTGNPEKKKEIKFFKLKEEYVFNKTKYIKGQIFGQIDKNCVWKLATPTEKSQYDHRYTFSHIPMDKLEEVDIKNEKWVHPHINKEIKKLINQK